MLTVENLSIRFDDKPIFNDISFSLQSGQIACLLGASGCGKTTILRCIAGFETPNTGRITLDERVLVDHQTHIAAHKRHIGMVFQDYALFPHLTVQQNIAFGLKELNTKQQQERIEEMLSLINMTEYKNSYPHELSGGQQQRVALVRAIAPRPSLILLDEPFSNLDVDLRTSLSKEVRNLLKSQNISAILVTHDQAEAFTIADEIGMMADGTLQQWDTPTTLYQTPKTQAVAKFIGEGVLFDIERIDTNQVVCRLGHFTTTNLTSHCTKLLIRPHDVYISEQGIKVQILDKDFRGDSWLYTLGTDKDDKLLMQISATPSNKPYQIGEKLCVDFLHITCF